MLLRTEDIALVEEMRTDDDRIDELHASVFDIVLGRRWKGTAADTVNVTLGSRYHERFADHAVSIAHKVHYLATGGWTKRHRRIPLCSADGRHPSPALESGVAPRSARPRRPRRS